MTIHSRQGRRFRLHRDASPYALLVAFAAVVAAGTVAAQPLPEAEPSPAVVAFQKGIDAFLAARARAASKVAPLEENASPTQLTAREAAFGQALQRERSAARVGDLFGPAQEELRRSVAEDWERRTPDEREGLLAEMPDLAAPAVNSVYPTELPLLTTPTRLLERLPALPEVLEYRIYGHHLILRDAEANLVVDVLPGAIPALGARGSAP